MDFVWWIVMMGKKCVWIVYYRESFTSILFGNVIYRIIVLLIYSKEKWFNDIFNVFEGGEYIFK